MKISTFALVLFTQISALNSIPINFLKPFFRCFSSCLKLEEQPSATNQLILTSLKTAEKEKSFVGSSIDIDSQKVTLASRQTPAKQVSRDRDSTSMDVSAPPAKLAASKASSSTAALSTIPTFDSLKIGDLVESRQNGGVSFTLLNYLGSGEEGKVFSALVSFASNQPDHSSPIALKFYKYHLSRDERRLNTALGRIPTVSSSSPILLEAFQLPNSHTWVQPMKLYENVLDLQDAVRFHPYYSTLAGRQDLFEKSKVELENLFNKWGYVFNDVSGKNILVQTDGSSVHLIDFGQVKSVDDYWTKAAAQDAVRSDIANLSDEIFHRFKIPQLTDLQVESNQVPGTG